MVVIKTLTKSRLLTFLQLKRTAFCQSAATIPKKSIVWLTPIFCRLFFQVSTSSGVASSDSPLISKEPSPRSLGTDEEEDEDDILNQIDEEAMTPEAEMEYCDPCYCYGKCCMDIVASIFCVSLL